jgi:hypothetical protein
MMDPAAVAQMTRLLDLPLRPPAYPAGEQPWCAWGDPPAAPLQTCAIPGAPAAYPWERTVRCFAAPRGSERLPLEVDCASPALRGAPVIAEETGALVTPSAAAAVAAQYAYAVPPCSVSVQLAPWTPAQGARALQARSPGARLK